MGGHSLRNHGIFTELNNKINFLYVAASTLSNDKSRLLKGRKFKIDGVYYDQVVSRKLLTFFRFISSIRKVGVLFRYILIFILNPIILAFKVNVQKFDIIHGHSDWQNGIGAYLLAKRYNKKFIYDLHALSFDNIEKSNRNYKLAKKTESLLIRKADAIITIDSSLKDHICDLFNISPEKIFIAPNGINGEFFKRNIKQTKGNIVPENRFIIGVNDSKEMEGFQFIIDNKEKIIKHIPNAFFLVFASKDKNRFFDKNYFKLLPKVEFEKMPYYYSLTDLFILPRINNNMTQTITPLKILEIMSCEVPVFVSNVKGLISCVKDNKTGFIYNVGDIDDFINKIIEIYKLPNLEQIGKNGREWVLQNKSWNNAALQYLKAYEYIRK